MLKLRLLTGPRAGRQLRVSDTKPVSIGRRLGRLRLHDSRVSKHHAEIYYDNNMWILRDLGSANGTYVNRNKVSGLIELEPGDMVQMGRVLLKITRCDGIGMDTGPMQPDGLEDDAEIGMDPIAKAPSSIQDDDDIDLSAIFGESDNDADADKIEDAQNLDDANEGSDALEALNQPVASASSDDDEEATLDVPQPLDIAFQDPADDDDSFFADIGEATDTTDGEHLKADARKPSSTDVDSDDDEDAELDEDDLDPLLSGVDQSELADDADQDQTSDLISLDDTLKSGPPSAGTTLLTSVDHDGSAADDDEKPALVGLHLEHAPPQQPEVAEEDDARDDVDSLIDEDKAPAIEVAAEAQTPVNNAVDINAQVDLDQESDEDTSLPEFDIDAAFDALSEGLDDSFELPALDAEAESDASDLRSEQDQEPEQEPDPLVGSQLDVNFIKEALSRLEDQPTPDEPNEPDKPAPKSAAAPATLPTPPPATPRAESYLQSPPPGLNPMSLHPPVEPRRSTRPTKNGKTGRWFLTLLLFMGLGGVGGWLISQNYDKLITGRADAASPDIASQPQTPKLTPPSPTGPIVTLPRTPGTPAEPSEPIEPISPAQPTPPQPTGPDPFSSGPTVLGGEALQGLIRDSTTSRPLDPAQPPTDTGRQPDTIRLPDVAKVNPDGTIIKPTQGDPSILKPGTDDNPAPAVDQPPARIVFLVDASGSLVDSLPQMLVWLREALQTVEQDERFAVYFFKNAKPIAIQPAGMLKPSRELLAQLSEDWLNPESAPIFPSGRSDPSQALAAALALNPTDLYLLSDDAFGFHQGDTTAEQAIKNVIDIVGQQDIRIHGVQFFYRSEASVLETLANQYNGTYEFVRERVIPDADPIDLLEELNEGE